MNNLILDFSRKYNFSHDESSILINKMERIDIKKNTPIIEQGKYNPNLYIINHGIIRAYISNANHETTEWFASRAEIIFSVCCYTSNLASRFTIETITDTTLYCISRIQLLELFNSSLSFANLGRKLIEQHCMAVENCMLDWEKPTAKDRYIALMRMDPNIIRNVPLQQIASYLRITPQSLSRIRAQL